MRRKDDRLVAVAVSDSERDALTAMRIAVGIDSDANLLRTALWSLGDHIGVDMPNGVFDLRTREKAHLVVNPKISQREEGDPMNLQESFSFDAPLCSGKRQSFSDSNRKAR